jgi:hypothetical protein
MYDEEEKLLIKEVLEEEPELMYLTDIGVLLSDYMKAATMLNDNELDPASKYRTYAICLVKTIGRRYNNLTEYIH